MTTILVTGGTGRVGRRTVGHLREAGARVRVLSRHGGGVAGGVEHITGDLTTGEGVDAAVKGADVIVHCAASTRFPELTAQVRTLVRAASPGGAHLVYISVVGADRVPVISRVDRSVAGYFATVRECEQIISRSGLPWTTLRASQFHDGFILVMVRAMARLPVIPVPSGWRFQPIDAGEVGARLAELALGAPAGLVPDMAGPRVYTAAALIRSYLQATRRHRLLVPVRVPGKASAAIRAGANLAPDHATGRRTWETFLAEDVAGTLGGRSRQPGSPSAARGG
ncbi:MAG TPA: SDR family oxidoreductase [Candidatus Binatia bacterium]|nr:SDR family oxidoreductase [Candidatus Binatia bacterium]